MFNYNTKIAYCHKIKNNNRNIIQTAGEGITDIKGAVINSNSDNLTLETKDLTYSNIQDTYYTETKGFNFNTTIGSDPDKGKTNIAPMGSTTIGLKSTGSEKEQTTHSTIGNGSIMIANKEVNKENNNLDLIRDLNRDKNNSQEITKDMITGALDGSMTIDNRLLFGFIDQNVYERDEDGKVKKDADGKSIVMKDKNGNNITTNGYKSIGSDVRNFGGNTSKALSGATTTVINPFYTAYNVISNDKIGMNEIASQWKANQNAGANMININKDVINNLSKGQSIADIQEATGNQVLVYGNENDKVYGFYDNNGKQIYINAESGAVINTDTFIKTYGHETGHKYTKNEEIAKNSGSFGSFIYGLSNMTSFTGVNKDGGATTNSWRESQMSSWDSADMLVNNSNMAGDVREEDRSDLRHDQSLGDSKITSSFVSNRVHPIDGVSRNHNGVDTIPIEGNNNTTVHSLADGVSLGTYFQKNEETGTGWGNYVYAEYIDPEGATYRVRYAHLQDGANVPAGTQIREGQPLGTMGDTGGASGVHLHIEVEEKNSSDGKWKKINPKSVKLGNYEYLKDIKDYEKK